MTTTKCTRREYAAKLLEQPVVCLAEILKKRADVEYLIGGYPKASEDYKRAKTLFITAGYINKCGEVDHALGDMSINMGSFQQAEEYLTKALNIFIEYRDEINIAKCYKELGKVCQYRENPDNALSYYKKALKKYDNLKNTQGHNVIMEYMADVYRSKGDYDKALEAIEKLLKKYEGCCEHRTICRIYKLAGNVYMGKGNNELSKIYLDKAYQYTIKTGESSLAMYILCDIGLACYNLGDYNSACEHFEQCLGLAEKLDSTYMKAVNLVNLADARFKMGDIERSKACIKRAATINHNIGGLNSEIQRIKKEIAQKEGNQKEACQEKNRETQESQVPHAF